MFSLRNITTKLALASAATLLLSHALQAAPINWRHSVDGAKLEASQSGKLVLLHFYTPSCGPCQKLERDVFSQPQIATVIEQNYIPVKLNADISPAIANAYQVSRVPSEVVLTSQGNLIQKLNCPLDPNSYGAQLANVAQHYQARTANQTASAQAPINSAYAGLKIGQPANQISGTQPTAAKQAVAVQPQMTTNPYFAASPRISPPTAAKQPSAAVTPSNSGSRYGDRYVPPSPTAVIAKPTGVQPSVTQPSVAQTQAPVTPTAPTTTKTSSPAVAAIVAKPPISQAEKTRPVVAEVWPPNLPAGTPPLAFEGYCPVSLREAKKWVRGNKEFGAIHRGRTYLFASASLRQQFLASNDSSDSFSPVFAGNDPVKLLDDNEQIAGSRKFGFEYRNAFYLFSSKETMERFARQPDRYSTGVRQAMARMDAAANGSVRR